MLRIEPGLGRGEQRHHGARQRRAHRETLADVLGQTNAVFKLEVTPNRPDQLSHIGVAREIAALYRTPLRLPEMSPPAESPDETDVEVDVADPADCFRFVARVIHGVAVKPSPPWLKTALERVGVHSVNNIVDATNYVMMEVGQPLHGYDLGALPSAHMGVRRARRGERLEALDGVTYALDDTHLIITAEDEAVGVAGVIGGAGARIAESTTDVLLESAAFDPRTVRRTRRALNISTDASYRFERGSDRDVCRAAARFAGPPTRRIFARWRSSSMQNCARWRREAPCLRHRSGLPFWLRSTSRTSCSSCAALRPKSFPASNGARSR